MRMINGEQCLMRIFLGEGDRWQHRPLSEALVELFRRNNFAGVTVLHGVAGYGAHSVYHTDKLLELSTDLPVIIETVEERRRIELIMAEINDMMSGGMITLEKVEVIRYPCGGRGEEDQS